MSILAPVTFEVTHLDGSKETVELKRLSLRQLYRFIEVLGGRDSSEMVALCTGKSAEWFDTLTDESGAQLAKECADRNFQRAATLAQTDPLAGMRMAPFFGVAANAIGTAEALGVIGKLSSVAPQLSASVEATSMPASISPSTDSSPSSTPTTDSAPKIA